MIVAGQQNTHKEAKAGTCRLLAKGDVLVIACQQNTHTDLADACRLLAKDDVFGVEAGDAGSPDSILCSLYSVPDWRLICYSMSAKHTHTHRSS